MTLSLRQSVVVTNVQPLSHICPSTPEFASVSTLHQSAIVIKYSTIIRYLSDPLSVSGFSSVSGLHQLLAFDSQRPSLVIGFYQSATFINY
jgi:hypothetical protein